jgi:hypothetical protein
MTTASLVGTGPAKARGPDPPTGDWGTTRSRVQPLTGSPPEGFAPRASYRARTRYWGLGRTV